MNNSRSSCKAVRNWSAKKGFPSVFSRTRRASGSTRSGEAQANAEYFLSKPFGPLDLARKVREVLDHSRKGA